jgi:hypothetical protein
MQSQHRRAMEAEKNGKEGGVTGGKQGKLMFKKQIVTKEFKRENTLMAVVKFIACCDQVSTLILLDICLMPNI